MRDMRLREEARERSRKWRENNKERVKDYRRRNKPRILKYQRKYREDNPEAMRESLIKSRYGISLSDYQGMLSAQSHCCAICGTDDPGGNGRFHVDHCHSSAKVRGLLCWRCNVGLGQFKDDADLLEKASLYLKEYSK